MSASLTALTMDVFFHTSSIVNCWCDVRTYNYVYYLPAPGGSKVVDRQGVCAACKEAIRYGRTRDREQGGGGGKRRESEREREREREREGGGGGWGRERGKGMRGEKRKEGEWTGCVY